MILLAITALLVAATYGLYRAFRRWGTAALFAFVVSICLLDATGVAAEYLFGPRWAWNLPHHSVAQGYQALGNAVLWTCIGIAIEYRRGRLS